jgi:DNA-directed RNA polymerase subunit RPC12/RpoP
VRKAKCDKCGGEFQTNETLLVSQSVVCPACADSIFAQEKIPADQVQRQTDPTICVGCGTDNGDTDLEKLAGLPVCPQCEALYRNRPFPVWVKAALVGMVILVVSALAWNSRFIRAYYDLRCFGSTMAALAWNSRFIRAYYDLRCFGSTMAAGDFERGAAYFISASERVLENTDLQIYARFYKGILLLNRDKSAEALELLESCRGKVDADSGLDGLIMQAQVGVAFDGGDYDEFLRLALEMDQKQKSDPISAGRVASAYACKYAETEDEQYKIKSLEALDRARTMSSSVPEYGEYFAEYEPRILYRLHTREIISRDEFYERHPNGWTKEGEQVQ